MRILFAGTPEFAAHSLARLLTDPQHHICAVYTQPDRPAGRGKKLTASPVKQCALQHNIPVEQPTHFSDATTLKTLQAYQADIMVVVAYGLLLPTRILQAPKYGCINIHASLLPKWRGAAPIQRAIYHGDTETGVCIMQMEAGLDTGPVIASAPCPIADDDTAQTLHDKLTTLGASTLISTLDDFTRLQAQARPQRHELSSYAKKLTKAEATINWHQPAQHLLRQIHAFNPWPVAQTHWHQTVIRLWQARYIDIAHQQRPGTVLACDKQGITVACQSAAIQILKIQAPGRRAMTSHEFLNANPITVGDQFG